jgi:excisionase family DNA binding protein
MAELLSIGQVSKMLGIPVRTLREWRMRGEGPRAARLGRHLRYRPEEIDRWVREQEQQPVTRVSDG